MDRGSDIRRTITEDALGESELKSRLIQVFGLTSNEARVYLALIKDDYYTAGELSKITGIHRSRIYDNLSGLVAKGLIVKSSHEPKRFSALPIQEAVEQILQDIHKEHEARIQEITSLSVLLKTYRQGYRGLERDTKTIVLSLEDTISEMERLLETTQHRLWVAKHPSGGIIDWYALKSQLEHLTKKKADVRFLSDRPFGFEFNSRYLSKVDLSFAILDDIAVTFFLPVNDDDCGQLMITKNQEYVQFLQNAFLDWWNQAK